ncbi:nicotinate-nucleotide diphosphorylase (carboxylating) [Alteribacter lacisalsi]|uniref:Probable nicotinate-nucleotide pyrophosphorylase [carboxylating] n=1 Tax=Alteribacter lacisalsi TaxID=2045244 RepID=A0A2W0HAJ8_9BACI|nr:carboxylating nicotinate-nucleotide diphosphorylase [Alteribacter lacisalsi]PYZ98884.1 nicotinate-nucleotide diphosphorylase (carboxylating) [Alteribacter lacisalsi]
MNQWILKQALENWLIEDNGFQDITTEAIFPKGEKGEARYIAKEPGIFFGREVLETGYSALGLETEFECGVQDGDELKKGDTIASVSGEVRDILTSERVFLNLVQRLSGIATAAHQAVKEVNGFPVRIADTRKTTPGLRMLEKAAVRAGGASNHRFRLDDGVMIKDNHISACGSIAEAVSRVRGAAGHMVKIEVEAETEQQVVEAVEAGADVIMFDNADPETVKNWLRHVPSSVVTEVSGGINSETLRDYAASGVSVISMGALTHTVKSLDISLAFVEKGGQTNERD